MATETLTPPVETTPIVPVAPDPGKLAEAMALPSIGERMEAIRNKKPEAKAPVTPVKEAPKAPIQSTETTPEKVIIDPVKPEEPKKTSMADTLEKIRTDKLEEKDADGNPIVKVDPSKLTKEQKTAETFAEFRKERDAAVKELAELKAKLNGTDLDVLKKEREEFKKAADERQQKLAAHDVTQSQKYQDEVSKPLERILGELQGRSKKYGYSWKAFVDAVEQPDQDARELALTKVLSAAEADVPQLTQLSVLSAVNEYLQRQSFGDALIKNSIPALEAMKREESDKVEFTKKQTEMEFSRVSGIVFDSITKPELLIDDMPFLASDKKDASGLPIIDPVKAKQLRDSASFGEVTHGVRALQAYSTEILPMALEDNRTLRKTIKGLEDRISQLTASSPTVQTGGGLDSSSKEDDGLEIGEKLKRIRMGIK